MRQTEFFMKGCDPKTKINDWRLSRLLVKSHPPDDNGLICLI